MGVLLAAAAGGSPGISTFLLDQKGGAKKSRLGFGGLSRLH